MIVNIFLISIFDSVRKIMQTQNRILYTCICMLLTGHSEIRPDRADRGPTCRASINFHIQEVQTSYPWNLEVPLNFFGSPTFLAHLSRRLPGELLVYQWLRRPLSVRPSSVRQHFQTSSPLKPLGQLNSNFIWRLLRVGERKFVQMVLVTWPRWLPCPYMVKTL